MVVIPAPKDAPVEPDFATDTDDRCRNVVEQLVKAVDDKQLEMNSPEIGDPDVGIPLHPWHEELMYYAREALAAGRQAAPQPEGGDADYWRKQCDRCADDNIALSAIRGRLEVRVAALEAALRELKAAARATSGGGCRLTSALAKANELLTTAGAGKGEK